MSTRCYGVSEMIEILHPNGNHIETNSEKKEEETFLSHFLFIFIVDAAFSVDETRGKIRKVN